jgi:hypothetical protein
VGSYYYLVSQLPSLSYGVSAAIEIKDFVELCRTFLSTQDFSLLQYCRLDPEGNQPLAFGPGYQFLPEPVGSPLLDNWRIWERTLRLHLARQRLQHVKGEQQSLADAPADPMDAAMAAKNAVAIESPLEAELFLDRARWSAIEALQGFDYFGRDTVYAYYLKLQLLERRQKFQVDEGFEAYQGLYASIMDAAQSRIYAGEPK